MSFNDDNIIHQGHEIVFCEKCNHPNLIKSTPFKRRKTKNRHIPVDDVLWNIMKMYKEIYGSHSATLAALINHHNKTLPLLQSFKNEKLEIEKYESNNTVKIED